MSRPLALPVSPLWAGATAVMASLIVQNIGASFAKQLFASVGPAGMTALRIGLAAPMLLLLSGAWRRWPRQGALATIIAYGLALGVMNALIYQAFARIPIGIAVAIEVLGPLAVVLSGARRWVDVAWLCGAVTGLALLLPLHEASSALDPIGIACAIGAAVAWALYIIFGKRASALPGLDAVAWGMVCAAILTAPLGIHAAGSALLSPTVLLVGAAVAALSSAIPYALEITALRRMPAHLFGVLIGTAPAVAALAGFIVLGESLQPLQMLAIALIAGATIGSTLSARLARA